jgi:hypothetical protein
MLVRFVVADRASCRSAYNAVVTRHMADAAADYGAFDAAFGIRWIDSGKAHRYGYARTRKKCFHRSLPLLARCNKPTDARLVPIVMEAGRFHSSPKRCALSNGLMKIRPNNDGETVFCLKRPCVRRQRYGCQILFKDELPRTPQRWSPRPRRR